MKYASRSYARLMKTITVWLMVLFLFAPITTIVTTKDSNLNRSIKINPNTAQAANECTVTNAIFTPSTTGWKGSDFQTKFYKGRIKNDKTNFYKEQETVKIQVRT
ncbi:MAG: hypothetical protein ACR2IQ_00940, partial [Minisyncoccia bacterium]